MKRRKIINSNNLLVLITIALFVAMYLFGCTIYSNKGFSKLQTFLNLFINNAGLICVTCGMTCVMLTGGIDISVGSLVALDCMIICYGTQYGGLSTPAVILIVMFTGVVFGLLQGYLVGYLEIQPFIVTMAGMFFARGMTAVIYTGQASLSSEWLKSVANFKINIPFNIGAYMNKKGVTVVPYIRISVVIALAVVVVIFLMLKYTKFGRSLYAVGGSRQSAKMMGLNVKRTTMNAYMLSSVLCSIGGICYCLNSLSGSVQQATGLEMDAIASAVIGGTLLSGGVGNVFGSLFGVLINGTISTLIKTNGKLLSSWSNIATAALLCFFIILQSVFSLVKARKK